MSTMSNEEILRPADILELLQGHHLPGLSPERGRVLVARSCGIPVEVIASFRNKSVSAVRQDIQSVHRAVFDPVGLRPDPFLLAWWVSLHRECCLVEEFLLAEKRELLTG